MKIHELSPAFGSRKKRKRVGRGAGSGHGKTACKGHKGQNARSGGGVRPGFEGGQMPLQRRLPKRGFSNMNRKEYSVINVSDLSRFEGETRIDIAALDRAGFIKGSREGIKLLAEGEISRAVNIQVHRASRKAMEKIEAAGGSVEFV